MKTFLATTLTETAVSTDRRRFKLTFVDADGQQYAISIPCAIAAELVPVLESVACDASLDLGAALRGAVAALAGPDRTIPAVELEVAILDRALTHRAFRRLTLAQLEPLLSPPAG